MAEQIMAYIKCQSSFFALVRDDATRVWSLRALNRSEKPSPELIINGPGLCEAVSEGGGRVLVLKLGELEVLDFEGNNVDFVRDTVPEFPAHAKFQTADLFSCVAQARIIPYMPDKPGDTAYASSIKDESGQSCLVVFPATGHSSGVPIPADSNFRALMIWILTSLLDADNKSDRRIGYQEILNWFLNSDLGPKAEGVIDAIRLFFGLRQLDMSSWEKLRSKQTVSTENMQQLFEQLAKATKKFPDVERYMAERRQLFQTEVQAVARGKQKDPEPVISAERVKVAKSRVGRESGYTTETLLAAREVLERHGYPGLSDEQVAEVLNYMYLDNDDFRNLNFDRVDGAARRRLR